ncbi:unnamed protein product [Strongylus vulgaris]|uniref:Uncharacterized protein n=1 Tax=Strongylus vulgaris TaxID=40348 RepID=A0A3P7JI45_STRVU|nr:unnamed protein product [Strongylus vulgaris]
MSFNPEMANAMLHKQTLHSTPRLSFHLKATSIAAILRFNLAHSLETASYGLVFGLNTFVALVLQSLLTLVVTSSFGLALSIRPQFVVYSGYHFVVSVIFIVAPVYRTLHKVFIMCKK